MPSYYECGRCGGSFAAFVTPGQCPLCGAWVRVRCENCHYTDAASVFIESGNRCPNCGAEVDIVGAAGKRLTRDDVARGVGWLLVVCSIGWAWTAWRAILLQARLGFLVIPSVEIVVELVFVAGGVGALAWSFRHRTPASSREGPLPAKTVSDSASAVPMTACPKCGAMNPTYVAVCPACAHVRWGTQVVFFAVSAAIIAWALTSLSPFWKGIVVVPLGVLVFADIMDLAAKYRDAKRSPAPTPGNAVAPDPAPVPPATPLTDPVDGDRVSGRGWVEQIEPSKVPGVAPVELALETVQGGVKITLGNAFSERIEPGDMFGGAVQIGSFHTLSGRDSNEPFLLPYSRIAALAGRVMSVKNEGGSATKETIETLAACRAKLLPEGTTFTFDITYRPPAREESLVKLTLVADRAPITEDPTLTLALFNRIATAIAEHRSGSATDAAVAAVGEQRGESAMGVQCSECGKDLRKLEGGLFQQVPDMEQWFGNVCVPCGRVYCGDCLELGGPTPCPHCGAPTKPAQRMVLREIGRTP